MQVGPFTGAQPRLARTRVRGRAPPALPIPEDFAPRGSPKARLEDLAHARGPLRRALAAVAGRFVERRAFEALGHARIGDYARERLGVSGRQLQDLAHVDLVLRELPRTEASLVAGEISWTKARLLARVAKADDEELWLAHAPGVRGKWWHARTLARRVTGENLSAWEAAEAVIAEALSAFPIDVPYAPHAPAPPPAPSGLERRWSSNRCAAKRLRLGVSGAGAAQVGEAPRFLRSLVDGLDEASPRALDARLRRAVALEARLEGQMGPLLLRLAEARSVPNVGAFARERLGISPRKAHAILRLERAGRRCPELVGAWRSGRLSWVKAHMLVRAVLAAPEETAAWIAHAQTVTVRRLEDDIERAVTSDADGPPAPPGPDENSAWPSRSLQIRARCTSSERAPKETARFFFQAPRESARFVRAAICSVRRHLGLATDGAAFDAMLEHAFEAWGDDVRPPRAHAVFERDGWRCAVPGCTSYRNLHQHHIHFRSAGGGDEPANLVTLCAWHHHQGVHEGRVKISGRAPEGLEFDLGGVKYRSGDRLLDSRQPRGVEAEPWT